MRWIETLGLIDVEFTGIPDRPVIGNEPGFAPAGSDFGDFALSEWLEFDLDGFDVFGPVTDTEGTARSGGFSCMDCYLKSLDYRVNFIYCVMS